MQLTIHNCMLIYGGYYLVSGKMGWAENFKSNIFLFSSQRSLRELLNYFHNSLMMRWMSWLNLNFVAQGSSPDCIMDVYICLCADLARCGMCVDNEIEAAIIAASKA